MFRLYEGIKGANIENELTSNLVGDYLFSDSDFISRLSTENRNVFQKLYDEIKYLCKVATANSKEARELEKVKRAFEKAYREGKTEKNTAEGGVRYDIVALDNGNVYVKASRKVVKETNVDGMRSNISQFFNELLEDKSYIDIPTIDGDVLTITKAETADKARDNYKTINGKRIKMTDNEFTVKTHIESHIDEIAEASTPNGKKNDSKNHSFAKDGFTYRKAYFQDFDGQYYEVTLSVGHNGRVATVYNVGKIKGSVSPSAKILAVVGSKPLGKTSSNNSISNSAENVKENQSNSLLVGNADSKNNIYSLSDSIENAEKNLYNKDNPLAIVDRAKSDNNSSLNWVYKSEIFSTKESKLFHEKISEINQGSEAFSKNSIGEYMIPIENKIVFTDGNYDSPYVREIVEVLTDSATEFEVIKETIFNVEKGKLKKSEEVRVLKTVFGNGVTVTYKNGISGVYGWEDGKRKGTTRSSVIRNHLNKQYRGRNDRASQEAQINEIAPIKETSSEDDVFSIFAKDEASKKYGDYAVYGEDVKLQTTDDIAPVREDLKPHDETDWRAIAKSVIEPDFDSQGNWNEKYIEYNSTIRDIVRKKAIDEVIKDIEDGTPASELIFKAKDAIKDYNNIVSSHQQSEYNQSDSEDGFLYEESDYTERENLLLDVLYDQYISYEAAAKNPRKILEALKKYASNLNLADEIHNDAFMITENSRKFGNLLDAVEDDIAPVRENIRAMNTENSGNSIKEQLRNNRGKLNSMDVVAKIETPSEFSIMNKAAKQNWVIEKLKPTNYMVERKNFGVISFAKKHLKSAFNYFKSGSAEESVFEALPNILENGIEISSREEHKGRGYGTVTIAAPITINGKRGNMAVVVKQSTGNFYKVHRVLTPDGSVFNLSETKKETEPTPAGESLHSSSLATPIGSASKSSISNAGENVNTEGTYTKRSELQKNLVENIKKKFKEKGFDFDEVLKNAKNLPTIATNDNTPQRVMEKSLGFKQGQILADETVNKVAQNESEGIK